MLNLFFYGNNYDIAFNIDKYVENGNLYIGMDDFNEGYPCPFGDLTVNLSAKCKENCGFVDVNNNPGIEKFIRENNLGKPTGRMLPSGWVFYPEYEFNMEIINQHLSENVKEEEIRDRYAEEESRYEEEKPYGPNMPWNAPGMKVSDFI